MSRYLRLFLLILFFHFTAKSAYSQNNSDEKSSQVLKQLEEKVKFYTLKNGLRVSLYRRGVAPVFSGTIAVKVGGVNEVLGYTGLSHMLEHMAFKGTATIGTKDYTSEKKLLEQLEVLEQKKTNGIALTSQEQKNYEEINKRLKDIWVLGELNNLYDVRGANDLNATTDKELTKYFVSLPRSAFEFWCWIESERILNPVMRQFYQERDVVMEERRMRFEDDPDGKLYENLLGVAYLSHPYRYPVIGYEHDIKRLTATMAKDLHDKFYVASNIAISLVGDVNEEDDIKTIEKYFSRIPQGTLENTSLLNEPVQIGQRQISIQNNNAQHLFIAYHKPNYPDKDDAPISIMAEILAGSRVSPMYKKLVQIKKLATSVDHDEAPGYAYPNLLLFSAEPNSPHSNTDVLKAFDAIVDQFIKTGATSDELELAKRSLAMEYLGHMKSNISLAKDFASSTLLYNNHLASIDWYNEAMQVNLDDIKRVAGKYLIKSNRSVATIDNGVN